MDDSTIARAIHVLAIVLWIGGVGFVTTIVLPAVRRMREPAERLALFDAIERRFVWQARATTLLAGLGGLYMLVRLDLWDRFLLRGFWWMHAMVAVWAVFTLMLFLAEAWFLHHWLSARASATFALIQRLHWPLLGLSVIALLGAVAGSHGLLILR
jgi:uncharacterized membrane protein